jgi:hypothetical protein
MSRSDIVEIEARDDARARGGRGLFWGHLHTPLGPATHCACRGRVFLRSWQEHLTNCGAAGPGFHFKGENEPLSLAARACYAPILPSLYIFRSILVKAEYQWLRKEREV